MNISVTIASLIVVVLGYTSLSGLVLEGEVSSLIDNLMQISGIVGVWYGRFRQGDITLLGMKK